MTFIYSEASIQMKVNEGYQDSKAAKKTYLSKVCYVFLGLTIAFVAVFIFWTHHQSNKSSEPKPPSTLDTKDNKDNTNCPVWSLVGDNYCDDEANIAECGYDLKDCCDIESDRSTCKDCLCYIPEDKEIMLEDQFQKKCSASVWSTYFGDGLCDLGFNNEEHFFDIGDCCLENSFCVSSTFLTTTGDFCEEDNCIQSNIFCVKEELGDGICQGYNNGPYCEHDLGDCCLPTESQINYTCNSECFMDAFYQIPSHWGFLG